MEYQENSELRYAEECVLSTDVNIFLTGKAGTGKTTFLRNIIEKTYKRLVVLAPTGVAAINAGGQTIHSFFQFPFSPFVPDATTRRYKLKRDRIEIIKSLNLLVIDEVSMVRADLLDAIDAILRYYRRDSSPFGGVQLLLIGDLYQLAPVVKDEEWRLISHYYNSAYFFNSIALQQTTFFIIELKHIFRQNDEKFINILGEVRNNNLTQESIDMLNSRYDPYFDTNKNEGYITLTTHNEIANRMNQSQLKAIKMPETTFEAVIENDFPEYLFPTYKELTLKVGAQVMFVKNDSGPMKQFFNGKIGRVIEVNVGFVMVACEGEPNPIHVGPETWQNMRYSFNKAKKTIEADEIGKFSQLPLKLAWAVTIHKSQGLTFDKAVVDINAAFAFGQVYVALSRCTSLNGLVLLSKLDTYTLKTDRRIQRFYQDSQKDRLTDEIIQKLKFKYKIKLLYQLFDFKQLEDAFTEICTLYIKYRSRFVEDVTEIMTEAGEQSRAEIFEVNKRFIHQLDKIISSLDAIGSNDALLNERVSKASGYYVDKLQTIFIDRFKDLHFVTDNDELQKDMNNLLADFELILMQKRAAFRISVNSFDTLTYVKAIVDEELDFVPTFNKKSWSGKSFSLSKMKNGALLPVLIRWRDALSEANDVPKYMILPVKSFVEICQKLPQDKHKLGKIKGIGKVKIELYGDEILGMIHTYCDEHPAALGGKQQKLDDDTNADGKPKIARKGDTKRVSLDMYKEGKSIDDIANERNLRHCTVLKHLRHFVEKGELTSNDFADIACISQVRDLLSSNDNMSMQDIVDGTDAQYDYMELMLAVTMVEKELAGITD